MFDLNYIWIGVECSNCKYENDVQLIDAKSEKVILCNNCKSLIQLQDNEASVHSGIEGINAALKEFENVFDKLGK